jgi:hemoglobin-like flavoprotein
MTPDQVSLVQTSFRKVAPISDAAADIFYDRLFEIAPEVRPLFPDDMSDQKKKLMHTLGFAVNNLHQVEQVVGPVRDLGRRHKGYGVTDAHYDKVGEALIFTLEKGLGDDFTPDVRDAWIETYGLVASTMKTAANDA